VGRKKAMEMLLTGVPISAQEALAEAEAEPAPLLETPNPPAVAAPAPGPRFRSSRTSKQSASSRAICSTAAFSACPSIAASAKW